MYCELMAEHRAVTHGGLHSGVDRWHIVWQDQHSALCGHVLAPDAETLSLADLDEVAPEEICPACWARYRQLS